MVGDMGVAAYQHIGLHHIEEPFKALIGPVFIQVLVDAARGAMHQHHPKLAKL